MGGGREAGHVHADLGDDHCCCGGTDPGDLIQAGHRISERGDLCLDLGAEIGDVHVQGVDAGEHLGQKETVVVGEVPDERLFQLGDLRAHPSPSHLCQDLGLLSPPIRAASIWRPETPKMSLATTDSLI